LLLDLHRLQLINVFPHIIKYIGKLNGYASPSTDLMGK
jgi:hypothetical protein